MTAGSPWNPRSSTGWACGCAGAFGTYTDAPAERFKQIGNAAGMGARQALLSGNALAESVGIARPGQYVELTNQPGFQARFLKAMYIPAR